MTTEFNFPKNAFGYIAGAVPAKMVYMSSEPLSPVEGLWWVKKETDRTVLSFYTGTEWLLFGEGVSLASSVKVVRSAATTASLGVADAKTHILFTSNSPVDVSLGAGVFNANKPIIVFITQYGEGTVTLSGNLRLPPDALPSTSGKYATIAVELIADNEWLVVGNLGS